MCALFQWRLVGVMRCRFGRRGRRTVARATASSIRDQSWSASAAVASWRRSARLGGGGVVMGGCRGRGSELQSFEERVDLWERGEAREECGEG